MQAIADLANVAGALVVNMVGAFRLGCAINFAVSLAGLGILLASLPRQESGEGPLG